MFSVRLSDVPQTTSFRLALLFLGLIGTGSLIVFGFLYIETAGFLLRDVDTGLARELSVRAWRGAAELKRILDDRAPLDPELRRPYAMFDRNGHWLAGSPATLPQPLPALDQPFDFTLPHGGKPAPYRGLLHRQNSGELLLAAQEMSHIYRFRRLLAAAMWSGGLVILVIGLAGGMIAGMGALSRIEGVTRAIERIVNGDLTGRLPTGSKGGDIDRLIRVVNRMLDEIERLMSEAKGVTENIAHDLRTPLTRLLAGLDRARRQGTTIEEYALAVDEAITEIRGILATFNALLRIAEVEAGARKAGFATLDLATVATDVAELFEPMAEAKGIRLALENGAGAGAKLAGDPNLIFEAIGNLVDNAIKFTPPGGRVVLRTLPQSAGLGIEVTDTGPGIPEDEREAVLRRFHRVDKCRNTPGTGLGLTLVAAVAKLHGLDLVIADAQPGCCITLRRAGWAGPAVAE